MAFYSAIQILIQYMLTTPAISSITTQIASKHLFGHVWAVGSLGIVVQSGGGTPVIDLPTQSERVSIRIYGSLDTAMQTAAQLSEHFRSTAIRKSVTVGAESKFLYWANPSSGISQGWDPDLKTDFVYFFLDVFVGV